ncbi:protein of unknown function [Rhodovastum atsumiense]|nr:protein of unknown function [Rhodovastum atsumiense]
MAGIAATSAGLRLPAVEPAGPARRRRTCPDAAHGGALNRPDAPRRCLSGEGLNSMNGLTSCGALGEGKPGAAWP